MEVTFKQQFDKLTEAYIRGEVNPFDHCACFVGNLLNGNSGWVRSAPPAIKKMTCESLEDFTELLAEECKESVERIVEIEAEGLYTPEEIFFIEKTFMDAFWNGSLVKYQSVRREDQEYEDGLFEAFEKTLDLLKQIHESKGEVVEPFEFVKRELVPV